MIVTFTTHVHFHVCVFVVVVVLNLKQNEAHKRLCRINTQGSSLVLVNSAVPLVEIMYPAFTRMPGESHRRRLRSLLYLCYVFRALINSLLYRFFSFSSSTINFQLYVKGNEWEPSQLRNCLHTRGSSLATTET